MHYCIIMGHTPLNDIKILLNENITDSYLNKNVSLPHYVEGDVLLWDYCYGIVILSYLATVAMKQQIMNRTIKAH